MNDPEIERSEQRCFDWQHILANSIENFILQKNTVVSDLSRQEIYKAFKDSQSESVSKEW